MTHQDNSYLQYDALNWQQQVKTGINSTLHDFILRNIISRHKGDEIKVFDMGFGIGRFPELLQKTLPGAYKKVILEGCEPSVKNYEYFRSRISEKRLSGLRIFNNTLLETDTSTKFHFLTAVYVFTHISSDELEAVVQKISDMLDPGGQFILVMVNEDFLEENMDVQTFRLIERSEFELDGKKYWQVLHYTDIPQIGTIIDHSRQEQLYLDLFKKNGLDLSISTDLIDHGYPCRILGFLKA